MGRLLCSLAVPLVLALLLAQPGPAAAQCAMCKAALTNSEEGRGLSAEFNRAIVVMLMLFATWNDIVHLSSSAGRGT